MTENCQLHTNTRLKRFLLSSVSQLISRPLCCNKLAPRVESKPVWPEQSVMVQPITCKWSYLTGPESFHSISSSGWVCRKHDETLDMR